MKDHHFGANREISRYSGGPVRHCPVVVSSITMSCITKERKPSPNHIGTPNVHNENKPPLIISLITMCVYSKHRINGTILLMVALRICLKVTGTLKSVDYIIVGFLIPLLYFCICSTINREYNSGYLVK